MAKTKIQITNEGFPFINCVDWTDGRRVRLDAREIEGYMENSHTERAKGEGYYIGGEEYVTVWLKSGREIKLCALLDGDTDTNMELYGTDDLCTRIDNVQRMAYWQGNKTNQDTKDTQE